MFAKLATLARKPVTVPVPRLAHLRPGVDDVIAARMCELREEHRAGAHTRYTHGCTLCRITN